MLNITKDVQKAIHFPTQQEVWFTAPDYMALAKKVIKKITKLELKLGLTIDGEMGFAYLRITNEEQIHPNLIDKLRYYGFNNENPYEFTIKILNYMFNTDTIQAVSYIKSEEMDTHITKLPIYITLESNQLPMSKGNQLRIDINHILETTNSNLELTKEEYESLYQKANDYDNSTYNEYLEHHIKQIINNRAPKE